MAETYKKIIVTGINKADLKGDTGATPVITVSATVDDVVGTPAVTVSKSGTAEAPKLDFAFTGLKGSSSNIYQAEIDAGADHIAAIKAAVNGATLYTGDVAIVKEKISDAENSPRKYTAYVYNGTDWTAMDGNYDAENVYLDKDLVITAPVGVQTVPASGSATIATKGKNLKEVFDTLFAKEVDPQITQPSVGITLKGAGALEVGTVFTPEYAVNFNKGNYQFGPDTGITATYAVNDTLETPNTSTAASGKFTVSDADYNFTVAEDTNYKVHVVATFTAGANPKTNLGNDKADLAIKAGTVAANSSNVTGFRGWFQGYFNGDAAIADPTKITSDQLRNFGVKNGRFDTSMSVNQMKQMFFAAPKGAVKSIGVANSVNGAPQTVSKASVNVEGANHFAAAEYDLFYVSNATAESGASKYTITVTR